MATTPWRALRPLTGEAADWDPLVAASGGRALRAARRGVARHARVLPRARRDHEAADRGARLRTRSPSRRTGPTRYRVNRYVRGAGDDADARARRSAASGASRHWMWRNGDVARLRRLAARLQRRAAGRARGGRLLRPRPVQPAQLDRARCCATSTRWIREAAARARERYACFDHFGEDPQRVRLRGRFGGRSSRARRRWSSSSSSCGARGDARATERGRRRAFSAEQNARLVRERRAVLPGDVPRRRRDAGTCATRTWPTRSTR